MNGVGAHTRRVEVWRFLENRTRDKRAKLWRPEGRRRNFGHRPSTLAKLFADGFDGDDDIDDRDVVRHTPQLLDWAVVFVDDADAPETAHLVPKSMLARGGAIYLRDGGSWRQVLPVDKSGAVIGGAPFDVETLFDEPPPKDGDLVAVQRLGRSPTAGTAAVGQVDEEDDALELTLIKGAQSTVLAHDFGGYVHYAPFADGDNDGDDDDSQQADALSEEELDEDLKQIMVDEGRRQELKRKLVELKKELDKEEENDIAGLKHWATEFKKYVENWAPSPEAGPGQPFDLAAWIAKSISSPPFDIHPDPHATPTTVQTEAGVVSDSFSAATAPIAMAGLVIQAAKCIRVLADENATTEEQRTAKIDLAVAVGKGGASVCGMVSAGYALDAAVQGTKAAAGGVISGTIGSGIGGVVGVVVCARLSRKAERTRRRKNKIERLRADVKGVVAPDEVERALVDNLTFSAHKLRRTQLRSIFSATSAAIGAAGGVGGATAQVLVACGVVAATNFWNPVGWTLTAVGIFAAVGITTYALYRHFSRESRMKKRQEQFRPISSQAFALSIVDQYLDSGIAQGNPLAWRKIGETLEAFDVFEKKKVAPVSRQFMDDIIIRKGFSADLHSRFFMPEKVVKRIMKKLK